MARVSFRIRRDTNTSDTVGVGSYSRGGSTFQALAGVSSANQDNDRSIRAAGIVLAFDAGEASSFEATAVEHTVVRLSWELTALSTTVDDVPSNESGLVGITVVYSSSGYPEAANDGVVIYAQENVVDENLGVQTTFHNAAPSGQWAYYTLFGRYFENSGGAGTYWYEKLASVEALVPFDYQSTDKMWERIPYYYRQQDVNEDLYNFVDIFGFELDRTRTLIQSVITGYDPRSAEAEGVQQLANMVGLEVNVQDIGVTRTRALLHDIGFLRRRKGTVDGVVDYLKALSGCNVDFESISSGASWRATVYAQRANLIADPRFVTSPSAPTPTWGVTFDPGVSGASYAPVERGVLLQAGTTDSTVAIISKVATPIGVGTDYYMSAKFADNTGVGQMSTSTIVYGGYISAGASWGTWSGLTANGEIPVSGEVYTFEGGATRRVFDMGSASAGGASMYPVLLMKIPANETVYVYDWMMEPYNFGSYFDGSSDFGGFLYQNNFNDHDWSGTTNSSYSTHMVQRAKTQEAIKKVCAYIMPVTVNFSPDDSNLLRFDWVPGKT